MIGQGVEIGQASLYRLKVKVLALGLTLALGGLGTLAPVTLAQGLPEADTQRVVAQLVVGDRLLIITTTPSGYRYLVADDDDGSDLSPALTATQLARHYPDLWEMIRPALAEDGPGLMLLAPLEGAL
jgi:hypothetical protein